MRKENEDITIKKLLDIFVPKIWIIVLAAVVSAALLGGYSMFVKKDTYTSEISFWVYADTESIPTSAGYIGVQSLMADYTNLLKSRTFSENVAYQIQDKYEGISALDVASIVEIKQREDTNFFDVRVCSRDPQLSKVVADQIEEIAPHYISEKCDYSVNAIVIDEPLLATSADSKHVMRNAVIGFAIGMVVAALVIFIISKFDVTIRNRDRIEDSYSIPILCVIPRLESEQ